MSLDIKVYCKQLIDDIIPKIVKRLNDYEMIVEVHPGFSFTDQTGFLPFKFCLTNPPIEILKDKELKSGFELYIDEFDLQVEKESLKPQPGLINKLFGKKKSDVSLIYTAIDDRLKDCKKAATFVWHTEDSFELRFALLTSAILTELTNGVRFYPADNIWYGNKNIVEEAYKEVMDYEQSLHEHDIVFHEFDKW